MIQQHRCAGFRAWLVVALCLSCAMQTLAQAPASLEGRAIRSIEIEASPDADLIKVRETIKTREGDPYNRISIQTDIAALYGLGEFSSVTVTPEALDDGVRLIYRLTSRARVTEVRFEGDVKLNLDTLRELLSVTMGAPATPYLLKQDQEILQNHYRDQGYIFAHVTQSVEPVDSGVRVVYRIAAGPRLRLETIKFLGNTAISDAALKKEMIAVTESGLFSRGRYLPTLLDSDLAHVREMFRRIGYLDATVGHDIIFDEGHQRAYLLVRVRQGQLYHIQRLILRGAEIFPPAEIMAVVKSREGGPYSLDQLEKDIQAIRDLYGKRGYIKATVVAERTFAEDRPEVILTLNVNEGDLYHVHQVLIRGNLRTEDHVIRRDVTLVPGEVADTSELEETRRRLANTGLFFNKEPGAVEDPIKARFIDAGQPGSADVLVDVIEGSFGTFLIGAGYSTSIGFVGDLRLTYRNFDALDFPQSWRELMRGYAFTGGGQTLTLSLTPGTDYRDYRLGWFNPAVWDSPYSVGFDVYAHDFSWADYYDDSRVGADITVGRKLTPDLSLSLTPRYEKIRISHVDGSAPPDAFAVKGSHSRHSLALGLKYDRRDNIYLTTGGYTLGATLEMAGTALGGDIDYMKEIVEARQWWTVWNQKGWGKHVLSVGGEAGLMQSTDGSIPIFDRFMLGGLGSLRGFEYRRVGPVAPGTNRQIGGEYRILAGGEYDAPLFRDMLRGVLFVDAGSLSRSFGDVADDFRLSAGFGVRARIPILGTREVPLSIYLGFPIIEKDKDQTEVFSLTMGTGFDF